MRLGRGALAEIRKEAARDPARRFLMMGLWAGFDGDDAKAAACAVIAWLAWPHVTGVSDYFDHNEFWRIERQQGRGISWVTFRIPERCVGYNGVMDMSWCINDAEDDR